MNLDALPVLDHEKLAAATGGDGAIMAEILDMMREELEQRLGIIRDALARADRTEAAAQAHKLQGSAAYTGAVRMGAAAAELEGCLKNPQSPCAGKLSVLEQCTKELLRELERTPREARKRQD